jgi:hypothetical protein
VKSSGQRRLHLTKPIFLDDMRVMVVSPAEDVKNIVSMKAPLVLFENIARIYPLSEENKHLYAPQR